MSLLRRPVATVLSVASTVVVGGVAWGLVSAHADGALESPPAAAAPAAPASATAAARAGTVVTSAATAVPPQAAAGAARRVVTPAPRSTTAITRPSTAKPTKYTVPTTVTIQAISTTVGEAQLYRAVFRGVLTATPQKQAVTQQPVVLMVRVKGASAWTRVVTAVSSAPDGKLLVAVTQEATSADYKFVFDAKAPYQASTSAIVTVKRS